MHAYTHNTYVRTCIHTHVHAYIQKYINTYVHKYCTCMHTYIHTCRRTCIRYTQVCVGVCVCVYACVRASERASARAAVCRLFASPHLKTTSCTICLEERSNPKSWYVPYGGIPVSDLSDMKPATVTSVLLLCSVPPSTYRDTTSSYAKSESSISFQKCY
jgi:hypothetical protein